MKRVVHFVGLAVAMLWLWHSESAFAAAEQRIALVIGNSAYADSPLANPANDARLMAKTLRGLGFDVIERIDADLQTIQMASFELQDRLVAAGKDAVGLFFYAGHGVQVAGENYLIPLGSDIKQEREVAIKAVSASFVLKQMEFAENRMNFVILDACRNNPLTRSFRSATRGLARMDAPRGSLVAYSTGPGAVAADGTGVNSPYTLALVEALQVPGIAAEQMFKRVRDTVMAETKGEQTPWEESSLTGANFYFNVDVSVTVAAPEGLATSDTAAATQQETAFWESIEDSTDTEMFEAYLEQYPKGAFVALARIQLRKLKETQTAAVVPPPEPEAESSVQPAVGVYPERFEPGDTFSDCVYCPEMVVVPAGSFKMGDLKGDGEDNEKPVHGVTIPQPIAVGIYEVTRGEFARFVSETDHDTGTECWIYDGSDWNVGIGQSWRDPKFHQTDRDPVVCINWKDAQAYVSWLSHVTGNSYRLLSEAEWEYVARSGTKTRYWYGDDDDVGQLCSYGNGAGRETSFSWKNDACGDDYALTAPAGAFRANKFGLHDMHGNVWEWVEDCWHENYTGVPTDGRAWTSGGECDRRVLRSGSWGLDARDLRAARRDGYEYEDRDADIGFRVAMTLL